MEDKPAQTLEEEKMEVYAFSLNPVVCKEFEKIVGKRRRSEKIRELMRDFVDKNNLVKD